MGDDLSLPERNSVRTPMQWSDAENAGFSTAAPADLVRPVIRDGPFGYTRVNVESERWDPESLLRWMEEAVRVRRDFGAFGRGAWRLHDTEDPAVFAHSCGADGNAVLALHNLAPGKTEVVVDLGGLEASRLMPIFGADRRVDVEDGAVTVTLEGYGYHWYRVERD
ncbi:MAG: hypothetical protein KY453_11685 [Gemmatimonadetes bacterium]|nr:hypothetical protein [Gemmatimonadota bacterium]